MVNSMVSSYERMVFDAATRVEEYKKDRTRILVQVGQCSVSVGAYSLAYELQRSWNEPGIDIVTTGCDGACFAAPQVIVHHTSGDVSYFQNVDHENLEVIRDSVLNNGHTKPSFDLENFFSPQHLSLMSGIGETDPNSLDEYLAIGGYNGLLKALCVTPTEVILEVSQSGLLGRGGAYFPTSRKWETARNTDSLERFLIVNAEEGEPGLFKDRHILEGMPHRLLEGALIAAYASGCSKCYVYVNAEAHLSVQRLSEAIKSAQDAGLIGNHILGSDFNCTVELRTGAGGYVCGEETTLINTMEGVRREPRLKPPFPVEVGLFQKPTVINNVETLANVPGILLNGAAKFAQIGLPEATGTKLYSLSGSVCRPGLIELPMGVSLSQIVIDVGGGSLPGRSAKLLAVGGPSSGVLPISEIDTQMKPGWLHKSGVVMGGGGVIVLDEAVPVQDVVRSLAQYNASESCGKCTPCREGTPRVVEKLSGLADDDDSIHIIRDLELLSDILAGASLCGLGQMAGNIVKSGLYFFKDELTGRNENV